MIRLPPILLGVFATWPAAAGLAAQDAPNLRYGPHAVGFTVVEALDSTRAFRPLRSFRGELAAETARPVQVSIWFPARSAPDASRMRAGDFRLLRESELRFEVALTAGDSARLRAAFIEAAVSFGQEPTVAARIWDDETPAVRGASPLPGPHPVVLHVGAAGVSNPLLPAYLASHGFVFASFPTNGRMTGVSLEFTPNALTLDTDIDDVGFVHALLRRLPYADTRRLAVASFSSGSLAALLWAMRDMQASAVVSVEGWERFRRGADLIARSVHYEPHRLRVPLLLLERAADEASPRYAKVPDVVGSVPYAEVTRVSFRDASHGDFLSHVTLGHTPHHAWIYEASTHAVLLFLQTTLRGDGDAARALASLSPPRGDEFFTVTRSDAMGPVPTEEELYRLAETDPPAALAAYRDATRIVSGSELFREHVLRRAVRFAPTSADSATIMAMVEDAYPDPAPPPGPLAAAEPGFLAVSVSDLEAAATWYGGVLGLDSIRDASSSDGTLRARIMRAGRVTVELIEHISGRAPADLLDPGAHRFQMQGIVKAGLFVSDIEAFYEHLRRHGVQTDERIGTNADTGVRSFVFRDPEGHRIQVFQR